MVSTRRFRKQQRLPLCQPYGLYCPQDRAGTEDLVQKHRTLQKPPNGLYCPQDRAGTDVQTHVPFFTQTLTLNTRPPVMSACGASAFSGPCAVCGANSRSRCSRCHGEMYCGPQCQRAAWPAHKAACAAAVAAARARAGAGARSSEPTCAAPSGCASSGGTHALDDSSSAAAPESRGGGAGAAAAGDGDPSNAHSSDSDSSAEHGIGRLVAAGASECALCGSPADLRCEKCRAVRYCGDKCAHAGIRQRQKRRAAARTAMRR
jgi:MYND finger